MLPVTRVWFVVACAFAASIPGQRDSAQGKIEQTVPSENLDRLDRLVRYLAATEDAEYTCAFETRRLELLDGDASKLQGSGYPHLCEILREFRPAAAPPPRPVTAGLAHYSRGAHALFVSNRITGRDVFSVAYCDGSKSIELTEQRHATVWDNPTEVGVIGLPWTLMRFGASQLSPVLRAAILRRTVEIDRGDRADEIRVTCPLPVATSGGDAPTFSARIRFRQGDEESEDRITEIEIHRGESLAGRCTMRRHAAVGGMMLPSEFALALYLPGFGPGSDSPILIAHHGHLDYVAEGPDPAAILVAVEGVAEIKTRAQTLFPQGGLDAAMDAVALAYPWGQDLGPGGRKTKTQSVAPARPALCPLTECHWPDLDEWLSARVREGSMKTRHRSAETHCLQIACTMVAKWAGKPALIATVLGAFPQGEIPVAEGVRILEQFGLDYVAVEVGRRSLAQCRQPFVVIDKPIGKTAHAVAAMVSGQDLYEWQATRRLHKREAGTLGDEAVFALISKEDERAIR